MRHICRNGALGAIALAATLAPIASPALANEAPWLADGTHASSAFARRFSYERSARAHDATLSGFSRDRLPTRVTGLGTYAGSIGAVRDRGNGNYFAIDAGLGGIGGTIDPGKTRIIRVTPEAAKAACRQESGVCVIRP